MRLPRMTTRRWMVAVAVAGILCLLAHRHRRFSSRAAYHESKTIARMFIDPGKKRVGREIAREDMKSQMLVRGRSFIFLDGNGNVMTTEAVKAALRHEELARRYRDAASFPWFPIAPDESDLGSTAGSSR